MRHHLFIIYLTFLCTITINGQNSNHLKNSTSPYLLAHKNNPVDWYPWGNKALEKAKKENKLIVISIGYSACHWCHVMEKESFSSEEVAQEMNANFVSIKVDREERQDIDNIYMEACRLLSEDCGWPLNIIALPDGKPIYATTYQNKNNWIKILKFASENYQLNPNGFENQGALIQNELAKQSSPNGEIASATSKNVVSIGIKQWLEDFDPINGGYKGTEKFPLPQSFNSLLDYYYYAKDSNVLNKVTLTLNAMMNGGIYDHLEGGFSRYSTDPEWRFPHFEKMLYDNAQLVHLYSKAYQITKDERYKKVVYQTIDFLLNQMTTEEGLFISSLNADSEEEEGTYYTWTYDELQKVLGADFTNFNKVFAVTKNGNWNDGKNILYLEKDVGGLDEKRLQESLEKLRTYRSERKSPTRDEKVLTDWNALTISALVKAYRVFNEKEWLRIAIQTTELLQKRVYETNSLKHSYLNGKATIDGFLNDYSFLAAAYLDLYEATFNIKWIDATQKLIHLYTLNFERDPSQLSYFKPKTTEALFAKKIFLRDDVVPSGNAVMCTNYYRLGIYLDRADYKEVYKNMLTPASNDFTKNHRFYASWLKPILWHITPPYQVAITGDQSITTRTLLDNQFLPNVILTGSTADENLPILKGKLSPGHTVIYVCKDGYCKLPTSNVDVALNQISN
ncbi:thioredoxin domain-containing protein [Zhouia amylolytica]|uniref:thioredoxin domain-containing protein n=1 Tax=Zhouia amylolytica TaxID=376730 RepID=UPI0009E99ABD|nr:thioredoxin domain-containing protein [Zhouia amylolytica]